MASEPATRCARHNKKGRLLATLLVNPDPWLQGGFDFKTPGFEQGLGDVLGVLVPARPLAQPGRPQILIGGKFIFVHHLLELSDRGSHRSDGLGLAPVGVSASLGHEKYTLL